MKLRTRLIKKLNTSFNFIYGKLDVVLSTFSDIEARKKMIQFDYLKDYLDINATKKVLDDATVENLGLWNIS